MTKLIFLLFIALTVRCYSQSDSVPVQIFSLSPEKQENWTKLENKKKLNDLKLIGIYTVSIILNGIGDGLNDSQQKTAGHAVNALSLGILVASPFLLDYDKKKWYWYLASYTSLRIGLFDISYNLTRSLPFDSTGSTSPTDKLYNRIDLSPTIPRSVFFVIGISIPITEL